MLVCFEVKSKYDEEEKILETIEKVFYYTYLLRTQIANLDIFVSRRAPAGTRFYN